MLCSTYISAKTAGEKAYFTGKPCCNGHVAMRYVKSRQCYRCVELARACPARKKAHASFCRMYYLKNREAMKAARKPARKDLSRLERHKRRLSAGRWRRTHAAKWAAIQSRYRSCKLKATPAWANQSLIAGLYDLARRLTLESGIPHHVDHIFPLKSDWVCGLHVETNLRVITAKENIAKKNRKTEIHHE
jgi:hypothetical protein